MDKKYSVEFVFFITATHCFLEIESKKSSEKSPISFFGGEVPSHEYRIFIKLKSDETKCYLIFAEKNKAASLYAGICAGSNWRLIQNPNELFEHHADLGKVIVQRNIINIADYVDYDSFWEIIKRGDE